MADIKDAPGPEPDKSGQARPERAASRHLMPRPDLILVESRANRDETKVDPAQGVVRLQNMLELTWQEPVGASRPAEPG